LIACFLSNISAKYYENPTMLSRVIAKNIGDVFFETQCMLLLHVSFACRNKYTTTTTITTSATTT